MLDKLPPIYFYIPQKHWPPSNMPESADTYWSDFEGTLTGGVYASTLQTYLRLKADSFPCELTGSMPTEGIVLAHRDFLPDDLQPEPRLLIICLKVDREPHPYAQIHVVLNPQDMLRQTMFLPNGSVFPRERYYIPHWPQPGLIVRDRERGDRFENIAFIGNEVNLAPELLAPSWQEKVNALGLRWHRVGFERRDRWNDFSYVDTILAVRRFNRKGGYQSKPALKLFNAWHAGVPAILGCDSAFRAERKSELDYLEVASIKDVILALKRLRDDKELRHAMVENGRIRAEETQPAKLVAMWRSFLIDRAIPAYERWCNASDSNKQTYLKYYYLIYKPKQAIQYVRSNVRLRTRLRSFILRLRGAA
ncbi:MAG TPA: hypothetical protein V6D11_32300 [Waterburya sp.]